MPTPGELRYRVQLLRPVRKPLTPIGSVQDSFHYVATVSAKIEPITGAEVAVGNTFWALVGYRITIRYQHNHKIDPTYKILYKGEVFSVKAVLNRDEYGNYPNRNRFLTLLCERAVGVSLFETTLTYTGYAVWENDLIGLSTEDAYTWTITKYIQDGTSLVTKWAVNREGPTPEGSYTRTVGTDTSIYYAVLPIQGNPTLDTNPDGSDLPIFPIPTDATLYQQYILQIVGITGGA